jgi:starch synthase (maltosyl-transferring)
MDTGTTAEAARTAERGAAKPANGRSRAVIDAVRPCIDSGAFPIKRVVGEPLRVEADVFADGHERLGCVLLWRQHGERDWRETRMAESDNDEWSATITPTELGAWEYAVRAWVDHFETWRADLQKRVDAGQEIDVDLEIGARLVRETAAESRGAAAHELKEWIERLESGGADVERARLAMSPELRELMWSSAPRRHAVTTEPLRLHVERHRALFSAWYELFPRSAADEPGTHGTLDEVRRRLPYVASMGFDVLYLPPIHPIGQRARKGRNGVSTSEEGDVGSPWAIGAREGGHDAVHPALGTLKDFDRLVKAASEHGMEIALDLAFQCSPDHPYVRQHPEWFRHRPDGSIQYAENPPKKYHDIYPLDFECDDWEALWNELKRVTLFWIERGVGIFRVDNPHTKPFRFWDWLIAEVQRVHPDVIFLAEAFTLPKKMYRLAKGGFSQSYTYFAWRNTARELREYVEELTRPPVSDLFRPNFWPNTPDILTEYLQKGGRPAAMARLVLAATLSSSYGIYGPTYELCDFLPRPGSEENLDSEKYQLRRWNLDDPWSLRHFIALVNRLRREHRALQQFRDIVFHHCDNEAHLAYSKGAACDGDVILCVVNADPFHEQWGLVRLNLPAMNLEHGQAFDVADLLSGARYRWRGADNVVGLPPGQSHIFYIEAAGRSERSFEIWA